MKYFSIENWQSGDEAQFRAHQEYIQAIRHLLPADLHLLASIGGPPSLNDGRIRAIRVDTGERSVTICIDGDYIDQTRTSRLRKIALLYGEVTSMTSESDPASGLPGPAGYGDHGFDEVELLENGSFEHRMLFSSGIEIAIQFKSFRLEYQDIV